MRCSKCGMEYSDNATFCPRCGTMARRPDYRYEGYGNGDYVSGEYREPPRKNNTGLVAIIIVLSSVLALLAFYMGFNLVNKNKVYNKVVPTPYVTLAPTSSPSPTPEPIYKISTAVPVTPPPTKVPTPVPIPSSGYRTYSNSSYGFSCAYPNSFHVYDDGKRTLYTVASPDGQGRILIDAVYTSSTPTADRTAYINSIGGYVDYKAGKNDFFAARVGANGMFYYKYAKYKNGIRYSFEVIYPQSRHGEYDKIVNDIYNQFRIY